MSKKYFIDSENVGDNWIFLLDTVAEEDEILVFYTAKSPHMNYKNLITLKKSPKDVTFIECCEGLSLAVFMLQETDRFQLHSPRYPILESSAGQTVPIPGYVRKADG